MIHCYITWIRSDRSPILVKGQIPAALRTSRKGRSFFLSVRTNPDPCVTLTSKCACVKRLLLCVDVRVPLRLPHAGPCLPSLVQVYARGILLAYVRTYVHGLMPAVMVGWALPTSMGLWSVYRVCTQDGWQLLKCVRRPGGSSESIPIIYYIYQT